MREPFSERIVRILKEEEMIAKVRSNGFFERERQKLSRVPEEIKTVFVKKNIFALLMGL